MSPNLREIQIFVAVYEELSFTAAAAREHATQSGISQHIHNLEDRLGVQLFSRQKGVQPTPAATAYYRRCIEVLKSHALATRTLDEFAFGLSGSIVVGLMPAMTRCQFGPTYQRFTAANPNVAVRVIEAYSGALTERVRSGELDFAVITGPPRPVPGVKGTLFASTPEFLVSSTTSALTHCDPVRLADIRDLKLIVPGPGNVRREVIDLYLSSNAIQVQRLLELDSMLGTMDLVARSDWVTIMPGIFAAGDVTAPAFTVNPIVNPYMALDLVLLEPERQPLSRTAIAFLDCLRDVTDEHNSIVTQIAADAQSGAKSRPGS